MNKGHFTGQGVLLPALFACSLGAAQAQETAAGEAPAAQLTANASVVSQYVSRGVRQTWGKPAAQAGVDYVHPSGWSAGTWASTISDRFVEKGTVEWDLYGGYGGAVGDIGYSVLAYYYKYPGAVISATGTKFDYAELSFGLTYKMAYAKYNRTVTRDFFGITNARGTGYLDVGVNPELGNGWTLNLHAGDGRVAGAGNDIWNWRDAKAGVTKTLGGGWSASAALTRAWGKTDIYKTYTTGMPNGAGIVEYSNVAKATFVVAVTRTF
ncbi:uncharacterized protein (TIGR02001 family) [Pseudoduganella flava]|uniref:Choline dehydrogenase n=1 Tax=Pseudoduganella flava TaxID=871742 RepID=A0A562PR12_9BURK|nr:TorF family putative porin [Pseudoduganella flava]QGZ37952.1 choline dehydrogenase [Pseudoduganella flava]TWI46793.1 uncharacterized protein (TIGR02001 family) [Pseudoduganella flava]